MYKNKIILFEFSLLYKIDKLMLLSVGNMFEYYRVSKLSEMTPKLNLDKI